ncbi:MAG: hydrogenase maturation protease [Caldilineae bacterium]|nr:MAG: hydrogenase maturation protease [Caldilineae bacterium]
MTSDDTILVIGYGNPLREDDGVGWRVAALLQARVTLQGMAVPMEIVTCHQLMPELAAKVSEAARVVFVDAADAAPPGRVTMSRITATGGGLGPVAHHLGPGDLLALAQKFYQASPDAWLVAVNGASWGYGERLSPEVEAAAHEAVACIMERLAQK